MKYIRSWQEISETILAPTALYSATPFHEIEPKLLFNDRIKFLYRVLFHTVFVPASRLFGEFVAAISAKFWRPRPSLHSSFSPLWMSEATDCITPTTDFSMGRRCRRDCEQNRRLRASIHCESCCSPQGLMNWSFGIYRSFLISSSRLIHSFELVREKRLIIINLNLKWGNFVDQFLHMHHWESQMKLN